MASRLLNAVERRRIDLNPMERDRITDLIGLVFEANRTMGIGVNIGFGMDRYCEELNVWTEQKGDEINYFCYKSRNGDDYTNKNIRGFDDPDLKKGEAHVRRLIEEARREEHDTV